MEAENR
jgi:hypothetical protein